MNPTPVTILWSNENIFLFLSYRIAIAHFESVEHKVHTLNFLDAVKDGIRLCMSHKWVCSCFDWASTMT